MKNAHIKSVMPILHNNEFCARVRFADGSEKFEAVGAGYNLAQCQTFVRNNFRCGLVLTDKGHVTRWHDIRTQQ